MAPLRFKLISIFLFFHLQGSAQHAKVYFKVADSILMKENSSTRLYNKLDTLKSRFMPSRSSVTIYFNRNIDFGYKHERINLRLNLENYQIDLFIINDTIYAKTIRHFFNPYEMESETLEFHFSADTLNLSGYLKKRNKMYNSTKTASDLIKEISKYKVFAFNCGFGSSKTKEGKYIEWLAEENNTTDLIKMLQSFSVEDQAYGISGFEILKRKGYPTPLEIQNLIRQIKRRNSDTITCSGCSSGLITKLYSNYASKVKQ